MVLEFAHIALAALALKELAPRGKQIFDGNDIVIGMTINNPAHAFERTPPPTISQPKLIPVVLSLKDAYGVWQQYLTDFPKANRFTLGSKIDDVFLAAIEYCFLASYSAAAEKQVFVDRSIARVDLLKLLLQLAWDIKALDDKKYIRLSEQLATVGRMLGGWRRQIINKTPAH